MTETTRRIIALAIAEWEYFGKHHHNEPGLEAKKLEATETYYKRVGEYWKSVDKSYTGKDDIPWSAAFISYIMHKAGLGKRFIYSQAHRTFINRSILNKEAGQTGASWWGHRLADYRPKVGDLVCYGRAEAHDPDITYDYRPAGYPAHSDIIVKIENNQAHVIGGNVLHCVTRKKLTLNDEGMLTDTQKKWFIILENRLKS